jgi:D-xylose transport system ATP-binding protein
VTDSTPTLELRDVSKRFGAVQALHEVDFEAREGEVTALVGDNGAGKSTLIKSVAGIHPFDEGEVLFDGARVEIHGPKEAEMEQRTAETLKSLSVTTIRSTRQTVATLSGGQRQSVAVARSVMWNSRVVILDEPTAALGVAQTRQVLDLVRRLAENGLAVVLISHNLHDIFEVADRATVLRLGRNVGVGAHWPASDTVSATPATLVGIPAVIACTTSCCVVAARS